MKTMNMASDTSDNVSQAPTLERPEKVKATIRHHVGFRNNKEKDKLNKSQAISEA